MADIKDSIPASPRKIRRRREVSKINLSPTPESISTGGEIPVTEPTTDPPQRLRRRRRRSSDSPENDSSSASEPITAGEEISASEASIPVLQNYISEIRTELHQELIQPMADDEYADESHNFWSSESEPLSEGYCHFLGRYE